MVRVLTWGFLECPIPCRGVAESVNGQAAGQNLSEITVASAPESKSPRKVFPFRLKVSIGRDEVIFWAQNTSDILALPGLWNLYDVHF